MHLSNVGLLLPVELINRICRMSDEPNAINRYLYKETITHLTSHDISNRYIKSGDIQRVRMILCFKNICWQTRQSYVHLHENIINEFADEINWNRLAASNYNFSITFLRKFKDRIHWRDYITHSTFTEDIILEFKSYIKWRPLFYCNDEGGVEFMSQQFIHDNAPKKYAAFLAHKATNTNFSQCYNSDTDDSEYDEDYEKKRKLECSIM